MIEDAGLLSEYLAIKDIYPIWNLSMFTQIDEINNDRHMNMTFAEFTEAICRIADKLAIPNLYSDKNLISKNGWQDLVANPELTKVWKQ